MTKFASYYSAGPQAYVSETKCSEAALV